MIPFPIMEDRAELTCRVLFDPQAAAKLEFDRQRAAAWHDVNALHIMLSAENGEYNSLKTKKTVFRSAQTGYFGHHVGHWVSFP